MSTEEQKRFWGDFFALMQTIEDETGVDRSQLYTERNHNKELIIIKTNFNNCCDCVMDIFDMKEYDL